LAQFDYVTTLAWRRFGDSRGMFILTGLE